MLKRSYEGQEACSVAQALEIVGERWTWLIIRDAFLGLTKFAEFKESLGIAPNVLSERLSRLVDEGIFERTQYSDRPVRSEYRLTDKGADLFVGAERASAVGRYVPASRADAAPAAEDRPKGRSSLRWYLRARLSSRTTSSSSCPGRDSRLPKAERRAAR